MSETTSKGLEKNVFLKDIEELKDIYDTMPTTTRDTVSFTPVEKENIIKAMAGQKYFGEHASLPMICVGSKCICKKTCPLSVVDKAPVGNTCHPPGEKVNTVKHGLIPIENLNPNIHRLLGYEKKNNAIRKERNRTGSKFKIYKKNYSGRMFTIITSIGKKYNATHDHICIAKFNKNAVNKQCVYLMRKGAHWRVGKSSLIVKGIYNGEIKYHMGFLNRMTQENADAIWILGVFNNISDTYLAEEYYSIHFHASKASFADSLHKIGSKYSGFYKWVTKKQLSNHHDTISKDESHYKQKLDEIGLSIDYPISVRYGTRFKSNERIEKGPYPRYVMYIRACNLIPELMDVPIIPDDRLQNKVGHKQYNVAKWETISISSSSYSGTVYSLDAKKYKTYFVNNIATHNCPIELTMINAWKDEYLESLNATWSDKVERQSIMDLVECDILQARANSIIAEESFIMENAIGVSESTGEAITQKQVHTAMHIKDMLHKRKERLLKSLLATREVKRRLGIGVTDGATRESKQAELIRESEQRELEDQRDGKGTNKKG